MSTIKRREYLFRERPRKGRLVAVFTLACAASLGAATLTEGDASEADAALRAAGVESVAEARVYGALGGPERFVLELTERGALLRFLCREAGPGCEEVDGQFGGRTARLAAATDEAGTVLYRDAAGDAVLSIGPDGTARLLAGARIVPVSVPAAGRRVLPTELTLPTLKTRLG